MISNPIIKNNKGGILVITIVSMMILTIIGYVTLKMLSKQNVIDAYDQAKMKTDYYAEGIVERARGYIDYVVEKNMEPSPNGDDAYGDLGDKYAGHYAGYLYTAVSKSPDNHWELFNETAASQPTDSNYRVDAEYGAVNKHTPVDNSYPRVYANVYCEFLEDYDDDGDVWPKKFDPAAGSEVQTYKLVGVASTTIGVAGGTLVISTVTYYFETRRTASGSAADPYGYAAKKLDKSVSDKFLFVPSLGKGTTSGETSGSSGTYYTNKRYLIGWRRS